MNLVDKIKLAERVESGCHKSLTAKQIAMYTIDLMLSLRPEAATPQACICPQCGTRMAWDLAKPKIECEYVAYPECGCVGKCRYDVSAPQAQP